jgi:DNA (cytosine-5)-methyltransferase 1
VSVWVGLIDEIRARLLSTLGSVKREGVTDNNSSPRPVLSLFSGAGGLDLGFEGAGFRALLALDSDSAAVQTYNFNRRERGAVAGQVDLATESTEAVIARWERATGGGAAPIGFVGGPPCQAFSVSNVHPLENDPRLLLPLAYAELLGAFNDRYDHALRFFAFENVAGLSYRPHTDSLKQILQRFRDAGFEQVEPFMLDAMDFGVPQRRRRMFIVGFHPSDGGAKYVPPAGDPSVRGTVREAIEKLHEPVPFARKRDPADFGLHPNHWHMNPRSEKFRSGTNEPGHHLGRSFRMLHWDEPSQTIAFGHREVAVHPNGRRRLSVFEAMLLQGFPSEYVLKGTLTDQIRLISDAVPPPLARALALSVAAVLDSNDRSRAKVQDADNGHNGHLGLDGLQMVAPKSTRP